MEKKKEGQSNIPKAANKVLEVLKGRTYFEIQNILKIVQQKVEKEIRL